MTIITFDASAPSRPNPTQPLKAPTELPNLGFEVPAGTLAKSKTTPRRSKWMCEGLNIGPFIEWRNPEDFMAST